METATDRAAVTDKLVQDVKAVIADTEELLKATAGQTGEQIAAVRAKLVARINASRQHLADLEHGAVEKAKAAAEATDKLVREHPWPAMGVAAAVGFLLGLLTSRRD
ncbi:MAG TPA: DUF883 family protein [Nitrospiria bacterium]|nr:DUF883 family protein [Nitrospiria bacterium]